MMATPQDLEDFVLGFSLTEELIASPADLQGVEVVRYSQGIEIQALVSPACEEVIAGRTRRLTGRTGCGICGADSVSMVLKQLHPVEDSVSMSGPPIRRALETLASHQSLNAAAGAVHAAAWAGTRGTRAAGAGGRRAGTTPWTSSSAPCSRPAPTPRPASSIVTSRASFEMVQKTTVLGAPLMAAISGPTGLAVRVARQAGLTLVGFARGRGHTVYAHPQRLTP